MIVFVILYKLIMRTVFALLSLASGGFAIYCISEDRDTFMKFIVALGISVLSMIVSSNYKITPLDAEMAQAYLDDFDNEGNNE